MKPISHLDKANGLARRLKIAAEAQMNYTNKIIYWDYYTTETVEFLLKTIKQKQYAITSQQSTLRQYKDVNK